MHPWWACTESADGKGRIFVWETATGKLMATIAQRATALALSPDNQLIASGNGKGEIVVHQLDNGNVLVALPSGRAQITALAFCRDPRHRIKEPPPHCNWVVGAGDRSGTVTLWELATRVPRCVCRGSAHAVYSISFVPPTEQECFRPGAIWPDCSMPLLGDNCFHFLEATSSLESQFHRMATALRPAAAPVFTRQEWSGSGTSSPIAASRRFRD